jgi:biopolymer transport protein ExbD
MWSAPEPGKFKPRRRPVLELGITPLIDIVFLLLIFFMLTSRFVIQEGIQVDLPVTDRSHVLQAETTVRITVQPEGTLMISDRPMSLRELDQYLMKQDPTYMLNPFEIRADRRASVQIVVSLLELLRNRGARRVTLGTEHSKER